MKALEGSRRRKEAGTRCMGAKRAANLLGWSPADPGRAGHPQEGRSWDDSMSAESAIPLEDCTHYTGIVVSVKLDECR